MKKPVIAIAVVVLVAAGIVLPSGYFGQVAERLIDERLANIPFSNQVEVVEYQRGWFTSTARIEWRPPAGFLPPPTVAAGGLLNSGGSPTDPAWLEKLSGTGVVSVDLEIAHGPVFFALGGGVGLFRAHGRIDLGMGELDAAPDSAASDNGVVEVFLSSFSGGTVNNRVELPRLELDTGTVAMHLIGAEVEGEWSGPESFQLQRFALESFDLDLGANLSAAMRMANLSARIEYPEGMPSGALLAPANSTTGMDELEILVADGGSVLRMSGMTAADALSLDESGFFGGESSAAIESMEFLDREFTDVRIEQVFGGLSEAAFTGWVDAMMDWSPEELAAWPPLTPQEEPSGESPESLEQGSSAAPRGSPPKARQALREILAGSPFYGMDIDLVYQQEHSLNVDIHLGYEGERVPAAEDLGNMLAVLGGLEVSLDIEVPVAAAQELIGRGILQMAQAQGFLQRSEANYRMSVALKDGMLNLNGISMPLPLPGAAPPAAPPPVPPG